MPRGVAADPLQNAFLCHHPPSSPSPCLPGVRCSIPDAAMAKQLGLNEGLLQSLMELPGTRDMSDLKSRLLALAEWNTSLRK